MSLPPSLNTIGLEINPDKLLFLYPFVLLLLCSFSLYSADISLWLKIVVFIVFSVFLFLLSYKYILLQRTRSIIKVEYKQNWFLHYQDRSIRQVTLDRKTVYLPFMLFLLFTVDGKTERVIVRRSTVDAAQYDALYVYLSRLWK